MRVRSRICIKLLPWFFRCFGVDQSSDSHSIASRRCPILVT